MFHPVRCAIGKGCATPFILLRVQITHFSRARSIEIASSLIELTPVASDPSPSRSRNVDQRSSEQLSRVRPLPEQSCAPGGFAVALFDAELAAARADINYFSFETSLSSGAESGSGCEAGRLLAALPNAASVFASIRFDFATKLRDFAKRRARSGSARCTLQPVIARTVRSRFKGMELGLKRNVSHWAASAE